MKPLVIVPARMGSKGVPHKNFRPLPNGESLVTMAVDVGLQVGGADVVVSTDHPALAGRTWERGGKLITGLERPKILCSDTAPMSAVVEHVLRNVKGDPLQPVILLQPTTPSRDIAMVRKCLRIAKNGARAATVAPIPLKYSRSVPLQFEGMVELPPRRQDCAQRYMFTGDCYAFRRCDGWPTTLLWHAVVVNESINIDTPEDWLKFEESLRRVRV